MAVSKSRWDKSLFFKPQPAQPSKPSMEPKGAIVFLVLLAAACADVRESPIAGSWYSGEKAELKASIESLFQSVSATASKRRPEVLIAPHAGHFYSGKTAAFAYSGLLGGQDVDPTVVILAPSHRHAFDGISVNLQEYWTPLGTIPSSPMARKLKESCGACTTILEAHQQEHSIEIHLPFLQVALKSFSLVPVVFGKVQLDEIEEFSKVLLKQVELAEKRGERVLVVASTDLSHFHEKDKAKELDERAMHFIEEMQPRKLYQAAVARQTEACGLTPVLAALFFSASRHLQSTRLHYSHSGEVSGDDTRVVGYLAHGFYRGAEEPEKAVSTRAGVEVTFTAEERSLLHSIARDAIDSVFAGTLPMEIKEEALSFRLKENRCAFVTLTINGQLRGCRGCVVPMGSDARPLWLIVREMAIQSAFQDHRFRKLTLSEWKKTDVEISALTLPERLATEGMLALETGAVDAVVPFSDAVSRELINSVQVGHHGLIMSNNGRSGLLLPQVPVDYGWTAEEFLQHTCNKAGMSLDCWRQRETQIFSFSAEVF